jgi:hypothetical protein
LSTLAVGCDLAKRNSVLYLFLNRVRGNILLSETLANSREGGRNMVGVTHLNRDKNIQERLLASLSQRGRDMVSYEQRAHSR